GGRADLIRAVSTCLFRDRVRKFSLAGGWLEGVNVKARANAALVHRVDERWLVDHFTARSIDEVRAFTHGLEEIRANQHARLRLERNVDADNVGFGGNIERRGFAFNAQRRGTFRSQAAARGNDWHAKGLRARNHL